MQNKLGVRLQVHEEEAVEVLHLPYSFECPVCRREQQHVLMCLLCGALFPGECEEAEHKGAPDAFWADGIRLADVVKTRWLGSALSKREEIEDLVHDSASPVTRASLGFLDEHSRPKWRDRPEGRKEIVLAAEKEAS